MLDHNQGLCQEMLGGRSEAMTTSLALVVSEHPDLESQPLTPAPSSPPGCSQFDPASLENRTQLDSPGAQFLDSPGGS